jgi:hypothetical protein
MDEQALIDCWKMFEREYSVSIDRLLCDPMLRERFVESAAAACQCTDESRILWTLMGLRKQKKLQKKSPAVTKRVTNGE